MKKTAISLAIVATIAAGTASAQMRKGFKAGTTRAAAMATAEKSFGRMDQNANGSIDTTEMTAVLQARATKNGKPLKARAVTRTIQQSDGNADSIVTRDEFKAAAGTRFDAADTNKNGTIDADEARGGAAGGDDNS